MSGGGVAERRFDLQDPVDPAVTWRPLASGFGDPTRRSHGHHVLWATRTAEGPATLEVDASAGRRLALRAHGAGAEAILAASGAALGLHAPPPPDRSLSAPFHRLARAARGLRLPRLPGWLEPLTLIVLQQKVSGREAARAWRALVRAVSEPAPGPVRDLWLPPSARMLRELPSWSFAPLGISPRQGETLRRIGEHAGRIEEACSLPAEEAAHRLLALPGIGRWSVSSLLLRAGGEPDVVPLGDLHLPSLVAFTLVGEARADDARMLELLEPCRGHRGWAVRWIEASGRTAPRRHPRPPLRPLPEGHAAARRSLRR